MIEILIIKILLVIASILTLGLLPLAALINMWIWNEIVINYVITCGREITSFWIILGLTAVGTGISLPFAFNYKKKGV
jgi:hypothetical protein